MKKTSQAILLLLAFVCQGAFAQTFIATGIVSSQEGIPLRYAFVYDKQLKNATYTDSLGAFKLTVNQGGQLSITCKGYIESVVSITDKGPLNVILKKGEAIAGQRNADANAKIVEDAFKPVHDEFGRPGVNQFGESTFLNVKETRGSQFFFNQWVHGYIVSANGDIVQTPSLLLNYNKMTGDLFMTEDLTSVLVANKKNIRSFVLFSPQDEQYTFDMMTGISTDLFCQVLSAGSKYKIYKLTKTKFVPSNYHTDGLVSTGNLYDEYTDENSYYVSNLTTTAFQPLNLSKKSVKLVFAGEGNKADEFLAAHKIKETDEWVKSLGDAMNQ